MPTFSINHVRIAGLAAAVPPLEPIPLSEMGLNAEAYSEACEKRFFGVRRKARPEVCQSDLAVRAAHRLLDQLGWKAAALDVVVFCSVTPDYPIPATGITIQDRLGVKKASLAFDIYTDSVGFLHGLQSVSSLLSGGHLKKGIFITGSVSKFDEHNFQPIPQSPLVDLPGHCGVVCAMEFSDGCAPIHFDFGGDGKELETLYIPYGGGRNPFYSKFFELPDAEEKIRKMVVNMERMGMLYQRDLPASIRRTLAAAGKTVEEIDAFYLNAAAYPREAALRSDLGIPRERFHSRVADITASNSGNIPLAMLAGSASALSGGARTSVVAATGSGGAYGSAVISTDQIACVPIIEE